MTTITVYIPETLKDRIRSRAEEIGMSTGQLAGMWLWEIERDKRMNGNEQSTARSAASRGDWDLSAGQDD